MCLKTQSKPKNPKEKQKPTNFYEQNTETARHIKRINGNASVHSMCIGFKCNAG